jgi:hypothetical protein
MLWIFLALVITDLASTNVDIPSWAYFIYTTVACVYVILEVTFSD